jgi:hypothetical protein
MPPYVPTIWMGHPMLGYKHHEFDKYETDHIQATSISVEELDGNFTYTAMFRTPPLPATELKRNTIPSSTR